MERDRVAGSCNSPPFFDGSNYAAWREKFEIFLDAYDELAYEYLTVEWIPPTRTVDGIETPKPRSEWSFAEVTASSSNKKARNAIVTALSSSQFAHIQHCVTARQAWNKLRVVHEGDKQVRSLKLQMVHAKFEEIRMKESESFSEFYERLEALTNEAMSLGKPYEESTIVQKVLRSLPKRFQSKKHAIQEVQNLDELKIGKLVGKLKTFEMELEMDERDSKKSKDIALQSVKEMSENLSEKSSMSDDEVALFVKRFRRILRNKGREARTSGNNFKEFKFKPQGENSFERKQERKSNFKEGRTTKRDVKCYTCGGIGHIAIECANNRKNHSSSKNKAMKITWSDSESDDSNDCESSSDVEGDEVAFVASIKEIDQVDGGSDSESVPDDESYTALCDKYDLLFTETLSIKEENQKLKNAKLKLCEKIESLESELESVAILKQNFESQVKVLKESNIYFKSLNEKLEKEVHEANESIVELTIGAEKVDRMLRIGKHHGDKTGLGFSENSPSVSNTKTIFVKSESDHSVKKGLGFIDIGQNASHSKSSQATSSVTQIDCSTSLRKTKFVPVCHYCHVKGHIRPNCNKLRGKKSSEPKRNISLQEQVNNLLKEVTKIALLVTPLPKNKPSPHQRWVVKSSTKCLVTLNAFSATKRNIWYLDSGCSKHMTGDKEVFTSLAPYDGGSVTFGGGEKSYVSGKRVVHIPGIPELKNVRFVDGLNSNLLSISQLCDEWGGEVCMSKSGCRIVDSQGREILNAPRSRDDCYVFDGNVGKIENTCNRAIDDTSSLWHQRLGHINVHDLYKLSKHEVVRGLPKIGKPETFVCGPCQMGKQTKEPHKRVKDIGTSRTLELIHLDLVGPVQTLSIGGKKYILVMVDDFSRYTWVSFLKDKSETFHHFVKIVKLLKSEGMSSLWKSVV